MSLDTLVPAELLQAGEQLVCDGFSTSAAQADFSASTDHK